MFPNGRTSFSSKLAVYCFPPAFGGGKWEHAHFSCTREVIIMEIMYYTVWRIDGDYAWLKRTDADFEPILVARALLPDEIDEGTSLKYELFQYEIV